MQMQHAQITMVQQYANATRDLTEMARHVQVLSMLIRKISCPIISRPDGGILDQTAKKFRMANGKDNFIK